MTCDEARGAFSDLYDGALTGAPLVALDRHLEGCPACRAEWDAFLKTVHAIGDLGDAQPSPGFAARVRGRIEAPTPWQRVARALFFPLRVKVPIQALALVLVAFTAVMVFHRSPELRRQAEPRVLAEPRARQTAPVPSPGPVQPPAGDKVSRDKKALEAAKVPAAPPAQPAGDTAAGRKAEGKPAGPAPAAPAAPPPPSQVQPEKDRLQGFVGRADTAAPRAEPPLAPSPSVTQPTAPEPSPPRAPALRAPAPVREEAKPKERASPPAPLAAPAPAAPAPLKAEAPAQATEGGITSIPAGSADELYSAALTEFARQSYARAAETFRAFIAQHPRDARVPDARFWMADAHFAQQRYAEAIPEYEALIRQFPDSRRVPAAVFKQAQARLALGDQTGCKMLRELADRSPRAREAAQAREILSARCP